MTTPVLPENRYSIGLGYLPDRKNRVVEDPGIRRVSDEDRDVTTDRGAAVDEVVGDDPAAVIRPPSTVYQTERNFALAIDERIAIYGRVGGHVPHENGRSGQRPGRSPHVSEQVVTNIPTGARVDIDTIRVVVTAGRAVFERGVFDDAVVDPARTVGIRFDELLPGIYQSHVVNERALCAGIEDDGVSIDVPDRQVGDGHPLNVPTRPDADLDRADAVVIPLPISTTSAGLLVAPRIPTLEKVPLT